VYKQAHALAKLAKNIIVKIPCHRDYYAVIAKLVDEGVKINITLVFSLIQGLMMSKLGVQYISPFIGRWDDIDQDGVALLFQLRQMIDEYAYSTEVLAASLRHVPHIHQAIMAGADAITVPPDVLAKATDHLLTDKGMELFAHDWKKLGVKQFP
jgi:transaldolase